VSRGSDNGAAKEPEDGTRSTRRSGRDTSWPFPCRTATGFTNLTYLFVFHSDVAPRIMGTPQILRFLLRMIYSSYLSHTKKGIFFFLIHLKKNWGVFLFSAIPCRMFLCFLIPRLSLLSYDSSGVGSLSD
jgi:hypothetical protein